MPFNFSNSSKEKYYLIMKLSKSTNADTTNKQRHKSIMNNLTTGRKKIYGVMDTKTD